MSSATLAALPNVAAVEATSSIDVRVLVGERRAPARVIGVRDFDAQEVDIVRIESGSLPVDGELVADVQDANVGLYDGGAGDELTALSGSGEDERLPLSGAGRSLPGGEQVQDDNVIVLYGTAATVADLSGQAGVRPAGAAARRPRPGRRPGDDRGGAPPPERVPAPRASPTYRTCGRRATGRARPTRRPSPSS